MGIIYDWKLVIACDDISFARLKSYIAIKFGNVKLVS